MAVLEIFEYPDPILKEVARPIREVTDEIRGLANDMVETMYHAPGIGLAAPQVGESICLIVIDVSVYDEETDDVGSDLHILINPEIVWASEELRVFDEGCLSVPDFSLEVERPAQVRVKALDIDGKEFVLECDELRAVCVQHEIDHLEGITLADRASPLKRKVYIKKVKKGKIKRDRDTDTDAVVV